jgi:hypothetical protein
MHLVYEVELDDDEEGFDLSKTKPKYSTILQEEDYEDEEAPQGFDQSPEDNYDRDQLETWDPWEPSYFFPIR